MGWFWAVFGRIFKSCRARFSNFQKSTTRAMDSANQLLEVYARMVAQRMQSNTTTSTSNLQGYADMYFRPGRPPDATPVTEIIDGSVHAAPNDWQMLACRADASAAASGLAAISAADTVPESTERDSDEASVPPPPGMPPE